MAAIDPNVYALQVTLSLDSALADQQLDLVLAKFENLEKSISEVASSALGSIALVTQGIESTINQTTSGLNVLQGYTKDFTNSNALISQQFQNQVADQFKLIEGFKQIEGFQEDTIKHGIKEKKTWGEYVKSLFEFNKMLDDKNKKHDDENDKLKKETKTWGDIANAVMGVVRFFADIDKGTENFITSNFRLYGSQQELLNSTRMLSMELGITSDKAIETIKSLAEAATPIEDMAKLAKAIGTATRTTGASGAVLADFARKMRVAGLSGEVTAKTIEELTNRMKKFGLSTQDVNAILGMGEDAFVKYRLQYGDAAVGDMVSLQAQMAAMAKEAGFSADVVTSLFNKLADPRAAIRFAAGTGMNINNIEDMNVALNKAGEQLAELKASRDAALAARDDAGAANFGFQMEAMAEKFGISVTQAYLLAQRFETLKKRMAEAGKDMNNLNDVLSMQKQLADELREESLNTLTGQLTVLMGKLAPLLVVLQFMADCVRDFIYVINQTIDAIYWFITYLGKLGVAAYDAVAEFVKSVPILNLFAKSLYWVYKIIADYLAPYMPIIRRGLGALAGAVIVIIGVLAAFRTATVVLGGAVTGLSGWLTGAGSAFTALGTTIANVLRSIGGAIVGFARTVGTAIGALLAPLTRNIAGVLALSVALIALAVAAYIIAKAVEILAATMGQGGAIAIILLTLAIVGLIVALVVASTAVAPVIPLILALAAAILIVAVAAVLFAYAFVLLVDALVKYKNEIGLGFLIILGLEMLAAAVAMLIAVVGFILVGIGLIIAGILLIVGAVLLFVGALILHAAFDVLKSAAPLLAEAMGLLIPLTPTLLEVSEAIMWAGIYILVGGLGLLIGAVFLFLAGIVLIFAAAALTVGVAAMYLATWAIAPVAGYMEKYGEQFRTAGEGFKKGVYDLWDAGHWMSDAAAKLEAGVAAFKTAMDGIDAVIERLKDVGSRIAMAGALLKEGGMGLATGAMAFSVSIMTLGAVSVKFAEVSEVFNSATTTLTNGANNFKAAVDIITATSGLFESSLMKLLVSIDTLSLVNEKLTPLVEPFKELVISLKGGAISFNDAASILLSASGLYYSAAQDMLMGTDLFIMGMDGIASIVDQIKVMATEFCESMTGFIDCVMSFVEGLSILYNAADKYASFTSIIMLSASLGAFVTVLTALSYYLRRTADALSDFVRLVHIMSKAEFKESFKSVASNLKDITTSLRILETLNVEAIYRNIQKSMDVAPALSALADKLALASANISGTNKLITMQVNDMLEGIVSMTTTMTERIQSLIPDVDILIERIAQVADKFRSLDVGDTLSVMADKLEAYVQRVEGLSDRLWVAIETKAAEALRIAEKNGLTEAIKSEAISTVKVMKDDSVSVVTTAAESTAQATLDTLKELKDAVLSMGQPSDRVLETILKMLEAYLPRIARKSDGGLANEFNTWGK